MGKTKIPDSQLLEKLRDKYKSYYAIAKAVGLNCNTDFIKRCHRLEELYGIPERIPSRAGRPPTREKAVRPEKRAEPQKAKWEKTEIRVAPAEPLKIRPAYRTPDTKPFPFRPKEPAEAYGRRCTVEHVCQDKITLWRNADMKYIGITTEEYTQNPEILRQIDEKPPIKTTGEAVVLKQMGKEYIKIVEVSETANHFEPPKFDLEMGDNTDTTKEFGPLFDDVDYIDEAWGKPTKLSIKEKIKKCVAILFGEEKK